MSLGETRPPPAKKRRFFDDAPVEEPESKLRKSSLAAEHLIGPHDGATTVRAHADVPMGLTEDIPLQREGFDQASFEAVVGEVPQSTLKALKDVAGNNTERAINMYLDGSWQTSVPTRTAVSTSAVQSPPISAPLGTDRIPRKNSTPVLTVMPQHRYVGAFGVGAWATRSGLGLVKHGEMVNIERTKSKQVKLGRGGKPIPLSRQRADIIVRFTNQRGEEVGRLPKETASWVSSLIDSKVCHFEGTCVFAPERVRINDTVYLQLRCYLLRQTFQEEGLIKPADSNRETGFFEEKETTAEQELRLRQVALVKLFEEISLLPTSSSALTDKHKREGILQAAEIAEQYEKQDGGKKDKPKTSGPSTPTEDDEAEEGKELEQDQLDSLYKKAQSFDFSTPTREPADDFVLDLRTYQKQALHWMMGKELDEKANEGEASMHPLWEEYKWPIKDVDDKELPKVECQDSFYVNPYSGEMSLKFPTQEQHCLGGILADGTSQYPPLVP